jgi:hypothetical protein
MRASIESFINWSTYPPILLTAILLVFFMGADLLLPLKL